MKLTSLFFSGFVVLLVSGCAGSSCVDRAGLVYAGSFPYGAEQQAMRALVVHQVCQKIERQNMQSKGVELPR